MSKEEAKEEHLIAGEGLKIVRLGEHVCPVPGDSVQKHVRDTGQEVYYQCLECKSYSYLRSRNDGTLGCGKLGVFEVVRLRLLGRIPFQPYKASEDEEEK